MQIVKRARSPVVHSLCHSAFDPITLDNTIELRG